jgi:hypothetical protein
MCSIVAHRHASERRERGEGPAIYEEVDTMKLVLHCMRYILQL